VRKSRRKLEPQERSVALSRLVVSFVVSLSNNAKSHTNRWCAFLSVSLTRAQSKRNREPDLNAPLEPAVTSPIPSQPSMSDMDAISDADGFRQDHVHDPEDDVLDDLELKERRLFGDDDEEEEGDGEDLFGDGFQK
jgi:hypothetical protein